MGSILEERYERLDDSSRPDHAHLKKIWQLSWSSEDGASSILPHDGGIYRVGNSGDTGPTGPQGPAGTARAYARVDPSSVTFDSSKTSGFTAVSKTSPGTYCLTPASGIDPYTLPAVVSVDWLTTGYSQGNYWVLYSPPTYCSTGKFEAHAGLQFVSWGDLASVPRDGFTIIVP